MIKYKDNKIDAKIQWGLFCQQLLKNVDKIEKETEHKFLDNRKNGGRFEERKLLKQKLERCDKYKQRIKESAKNKQFVFKDGDPEIILDKGWNYYFKFLNGDI